MFQGEHSAILSTFIKLHFVIKIFVLSIFEWLLKTGFTKVATYLDKDQARMALNRNSFPNLVQNVVFS